VGAPGSIAVEQGIAFAKGSPYSCHGLEYRHNVFIGGKMVRIPCFPRGGLPFVLVLSSSLVGVSHGQEASQSPADLRTAHLARMKAVAQSMKVFAEPGRKESTVPLSDEPVLRYADNTRQNLESGLWIWTAGGRPAAIVAIELYPLPPRGPRWLYEVASLSTKRIAAERGDELKWTAKEPGLKLQELAGADVPSDKPARRLAQMKSLLRRFAAHEREGTEGRLELRPLTSPLHRYSDASNGVIDGAIFAFANGTNPEVFLVLEASEVAGKPAEWQYALVQMTGAVVAVSLDDKEVWTRGEADPPATRDSYVNGWIRADDTEQARLQP
jgi:hypothetical protein